MAANTSHLSGYIGKSYNVGGVQVCVQKVIAEGGFGIVFLAKNNANFAEPAGKQWALKRVLVNNKEDLRNCEREIFVMKSSLNHPNIVKLDASSVTPQGGDIHEVLMLMEFCSSGNLLELMNQYFAEGRKLEEKLVLRIFLDVVHAVAHLHQLTKPVIHRDLKVENVLLDGGTYKLCDFGSCTRTFVIPTLETVQKIEEDLQRFTTLSYRSPEMVDLYSNKSIDTRSDIWALGVTLYKLCFFTLPFGESMVAIMEGNFKFPENSPYSGGLHSLICYLLTVEVEERPDIFQIAYVVSNMLCQPVKVKNIANSPIPGTLPEPPPLGEKRQQSKTTLTAQAASSVTQTSMTPRQRPKASVATCSETTSSAAAPSSEVDAFGASRFGVPAAAPTAKPVRTTHAAPTATSIAPVARHRRIPASVVVSAAPVATAPSSSPRPEVAVDAFGAPSFGGSMTTSTTTSTGGASSSRSSSSQPGAVEVPVAASGNGSRPHPIGSSFSIESFDPRLDEGAANAHLPVVTDPFGASVFSPPATDAFDSVPFAGSASSIQSAAVSPSPDTSPDPFNMTAFANATASTAPARSSRPPSPPSELADVPTSTVMQCVPSPTSYAVPRTASSGQRIDAFGAPLFSSETRSSISGHRRVSSDVTAALSQSSKDPFDSSPFRPLGPLSHGSIDVPAGHPFGPGTGGGSNTASPNLMSFSSPKSNNLPGKPTANTVPTRPRSTGIPANDLSWGSKQSELMRQKEKLEERQRALLQQQQDLARQQQQLAHLQTRMNPTVGTSPIMPRHMVSSPTASSGSPPVIVRNMNGSQVFANPMAQSHSHSGMIKFAHASSLSASGAVLTGAALHQQQMQARPHSPGMQRAPSPQFGMGLPGNPRGF